MTRKFLKKRSLVGAAVLGILAALLVAVSAAATNPANAPNGTHYKSGTAGCSTSGTTVTCNGFTLAGVGNTNATETLTATYTATVVCVNPGGNLSDSQHQGSFTTTSGPVPLHPSKNGNMTVPSLTATAPTESQFLAQETCPNASWTPELQGPITLQSYTYTLQFAGYSGPYITITG